MTRTLKLVPGPSIPAEAPGSPYVELPKSALQLAHEIKAAGVRIGALQATTTPSALKRAIVEAEGLIDSASRWIKSVKEIEG